MALLEVSNLHVKYGGIHALRGVSFSVVVARRIAVSRCGLRKPELTFSGARFRSARAS